MLILAQPLKVCQNGSDASLIPITTQQMAYYDKPRLNHLTYIAVSAVPPLDVCNSVAVCLCM